MSKKHFLRGLRDGIPIGLGYFAVSFGIGISAPQASWGTLASEARGLVQSYPIQIIWPVAAICLTMLSLNFIGDGFGEALDPKKRSGGENHE